MKLAPSNRTLAMLFIGILIFSGVNTFLIFYSNDTLQRQRNLDVVDQNQALNQTYSSLNETDYVITDLLDGKIDNVEARLPVGQYDYVIYRYWDYNNNVSVYLLKNGRNGTVEYNSTDASAVFNRAFTSGNTVFIKSDEYSLSSEVLIANKKSARLDSDGAILTLNGHKIIFSGEDFDHSQNNQISGFTIINGTVRIENSFGTTVTYMIFENSTVGVELVNTNTWSEGTRIDTVHFDKCVQGIVFRTNSSLISNLNSTGSYANTEVIRCRFNQEDNSVAITVEPHAEFTDSQMQDVRIWMGETGKFNQTGLLLCENASMYKTLLDSVVFESFAPNPLIDAFIYGVDLIAKSYQAPVLTSGANFLGNMTARIHNPDGTWIYGVGAVFKQENITIPVGFSGNYGETQIIQVHPATIASFRPKITVLGNFDRNETVTVRFQVEFVDNQIPGEITKAFNSNGSIWLSDDDFLALFGYPDVIYAILVDAKVSSSATSSTVRIDLYGTTT